MNYRQSSIKAKYSLATFECSDICRRRLLSKLTRKSEFHSWHFPAKISPCHKIIPFYFKKLTLGEHLRKNAVIFANKAVARLLIADIKTHYEKWND